MKKTVLLFVLVFMPVLYSDVVFSAGLSINGKNEAFTLSNCEGNLDIKASGVPVNCLAGIDITWTLYQIPIGDMYPISPFPPTSKWVEVKKEVAKGGCHFHFPPAWTALVEHSFQIPTSPGKYFVVAVTSIDANRDQPTPIITVSTMSSHYPVVDVGEKPSVAMAINGSSANTHFICENKPIIMDGSGSCCEFS